MSSSNGNGHNPDYHNRLARWLADHAELDPAVATHPTYEAEEVPLPPRLVRALLGHPAMRVGYGPGRWYPRLVYVLLACILASVLTLGSWAVAESRASRRASEKSEAWQQFIATKLKESTDADSDLRQRGSEDRGDEDDRHRARDR